MPGRAVVWPTDPSGLVEGCCACCLLLSRLGCLLLGLARGEVALWVRVVEVGGRRGLLGNRHPVGRLLDDGGRRRGLRDLFLDLDGRVLHDRVYCRGRRLRDAGAPRAWPRWPRRETWP